MTTAADRMAERVRELNAAVAKHDLAPKPPRTDQLFTPESARAANAVRYADVPKKPATATIRVESDIIELVKKLPTKTRVATVSAIIRNSLQNDQNTSKIP